jgi:hypothetical protein
LFLTTKKKTKKTPRHFSEEACLRGTIDFDRYDFIEHYLGMGQRRVDINALSGKHSVRTCRNPQGMYSNDLGVPRVNMGILSIIKYDAGRFSVDSKTEREQRDSWSPSAQRFGISFYRSGGCSSISDDWLRDLFGSRNYTCFCSTCSCCCSFSPSSLRDTHMTCT